MKRIYAVEYGAYENTNVQGAFESRAEAEAFLLDRSGFATLEEMVADDKRKGDWNSHGVVVELDLWETAREGREADLAVYRSEPRQSRSFAEYEGRHGPAPLSGETH